MGRELSDVVVNLSDGKHYDLVLTIHSDVRDSPPDFDYSKAQQVVEKVILLNAAKTTCVVFSADDRVSCDFVDVVLKDNINVSKFMKLNLLRDSQREVFDEASIALASDWACEHGNSVIHITLVESERDAKGLYANIMYGK